MGIMDSKKIAFRKATPEDKKLVKSWFDKSHVKDYWDQEALAHFTSFLTGDQVLFDYWICLDGKMPFGLIVTSNAAVQKPKDQKDAFVPWIEPEGITWMLDFIIGEEEHLASGFAELAIKKFIEIQDPSITAFLADPEVKNEKALEILEKVGFTKVSTFIRGQGFFKGKPHYLLKMKISP